MATYYMRADGLALNKEEATGPANVQAACMSVTVHNGETFSPADEIRLSSQGGNYTERIIVPSNGDASNYITYTNVSTETPKFVVNSTIAGEWADTGGGIFTLATVNNYTAMFRDGAIEPLATSAALTNGNFYWAANVLYYKPPAGVPTDYTLTGIYGSHTASTFKGIVVTDRSYVKIIKTGTGTILFENCGYGIHGLTTTASIINLWVEGLEFSNSLEGMLLTVSTDASRYTSGTFKDNIGTRCVAFCRIYAPIAGASRNTWTISGNTGTGIGSSDGTTKVHPTYDREFIGLQNAQTCLIYNNNIINGNCRGIFLYSEANGESKDNLIYSNFIYNNQRNAILFMGTAPSAINNNKIYNNIIIATWYPALVISDFEKIGVYILTPQATTLTNYFYNNVFLGNEFGAICHFTVADQKAYVSFKNNIFFNHSGGHIWLNRADITEFASDYNTFYNIDRFMYNGAWKTLAQWKGLGYESANSTYADPLFIDSAGTDVIDFKLQATSPCLNVGSDVDNDTDFYGFARVPTAAPDIGAIEFGRTQRTGHQNRRHR